MSNYPAGFQPGSAAEPQSIGQKLRSQFLMVADESGMVEVTTLVKVLQEFSTAGDATKALRILECVGVEDGRVKLEEFIAMLEVAAGLAENFAGTAQVFSSSDAIQTELSSIRYEMEEMRQLRTLQLRQHEGELQSLRDQLRRQPAQFSVGQYNILAGYLGRNMEPWFLYGAAMTPERRQQVFKLFYEKDANGKLLKKPWPAYVTGILTDSEIQAVERINDEHFVWDQRKERIMRVIREMDVDVLSLVECDHYEEHFRPGLAALGFDSIWRKRPRSFSMDGCCVAWRRSKCELVAHSWVEYADKFDHATQKMSKDRIAVIALLKFKLKGNLVIFVSTHLARNPEEPEADRLRARQVGQVVRAIASFAQENAAEDAPVILTGDLNAQSFNKLRGIANAVALMNADTFVHPFTFDCADVPSGATSCTTARQMRIDALLYQTQRLELVDISDAPSLCPTRPIPNSDHPSDHVPISASFRIRTRLQMGQNAALEWASRIAGRGVSRPQCMQGLEVAFQLFDHDGNGLFKAADVSTILARHGHSLTGEEIQRIKERLPANEIDYAEFIRIHKEVMASEGMPGLDDFREAFASFDKNSDGKLSPQELQDIFSECSPAAVPVEKINDMFAEIDASGDGYIDEDEFMKHLSNAWMSRFKA